MVKTSITVLFTFFMILEANAGSSWTKTCFAYELKKSIEAGEFNFFKQVTGHTNQPKRVLKKMQRARSKIKDKELQPLFDLLGKAYTKGMETKDLEQRLEKLKLDKGRKKLQVSQRKLLTEKIKVLKKEVGALSDEYLTKMHEIYKKVGIPSRLVRDKQRYLMLEIDFTQPLTTKYAVEFYRKVYKKFGLKRVTLDLRDNIELGSTGFYLKAENRLEMGPHQAISLMEAYVNSTGKHEARHSMFAAMRESGKESIFHVTYFAAPKGKLLNNDGFYDSFMSAEELYTFSTDLQTLAQAMKGKMITDIKERHSLIEQIRGKNDMFQTVARTTRDVSNSMIMAIEKTLKNPDEAFNINIYPEPNGNIEIFFEDDVGRTSNITFVSEKEKDLFKESAKANEEYQDAAFQYAYKQLSKREGFDQKKFDNKLINGTLSQKTLTEIEELSSAFGDTKKGEELIKKSNRATHVFLKYAKERLSQLRQLAIIQLEESRELTPLIDAYAQKGWGGMPEQLKAVKDKMFKISKNVKEEYKGFALN